MAPSLQRLDQIHNPDQYDDQLPAASIAASETTAETLQDHDNALISQLKRILRGDAAGNWYDNPATLGPGASDASLATLAARTPLEDKDVLTYRLNLEDLAIPAGQNWVEFTAADNLPAANIAIAGTQQGAVSARLPGPVGFHSLEALAGLNDLKPKNLVQVFDANNGSILRSGNRDVFALLQVGSSATDGNAFATSGPDQGQLSFVRANDVYTALEAVPVADIEAQAVVYGYTIRDDLRDTPEESFRGDIAGNQSVLPTHAFWAGCDATLVVGEWVYITGPSVSGRYQVARSDVSDSAKMPAVGVVVSKPSSTLCQVQWGGEVSGLGVLVPRRVYFLQPDSKIGLGVPSASGQYVQRLGVALDANRLLVNLNTGLVKRA